MDPRYMQLYREYASAIRAFENATKDRARVRAQFARMRQGPIAPRRPVGSPSDFRIAPDESPVARKPAQPKERGIYLGKILGWAKIIYTDPLPELPDPTALFDAENLYDNISLRLYWNAKTRYERAKRAFFDHTRRQTMASHYGQAKQAVGHAANLQYLGADGASEDALDQARDNVEKACQAAWKIYESSPSPKSDAAKILLLENTAEAQLVGIEDRSIAKKMEREVISLHEAGELHMVEK